MMDWDEVLRKVGTELCSISPRTVYLVNYCQWIENPMFVNGLEIEKTNEQTKPQPNLTDCCGRYLCLYL